MAIPTLPFCHRGLVVNLPSIFPSELSARGYPANPQTPGEHVKKRRLDLGLRQIDAARKIGISPCVLELWERQRRSPCGTDWQGIIQFLGYDPRPVPKTLGAWLIWFRNLIGFDQRRFADSLQVNARRLRAWEHEREPIAKKYHYQLRRFANEHGVLFIW